jgi:hypothetical protein
MLVMVALPAVLLAGCGGAGRSSGNGGGAYRLSDAQFNYLAGAGLFSSDQSFLFTAEQRLRQDCMQKKGFTYYPAQQAHLPEEIVANNVLTASGRPPSEAAQLAERVRVGYGVFGGADGGTPKAVPQNDAYVQSMSRQQQAAYMAALEGDGVPGGGCLATTDKAIYGGASVVNSLIDTPQRIRGDIVVATRSDPLVVKKTADWSRCFRQRTGRSFATPDAVPKWLATLRGQGADSASAHALEIRMAVADTKCGYSVGLAQAFSARFRWHADHLPASDHGALLSLFEIRQRSIARAKRLLHLDNG